MNKLRLVLLNAIVISAIVVAAYAISVSNSYRTSVQLIAPGLTIFKSCSTSGPSNPVTSIDFGNLQVGGASNGVTLYVENTVNGTIHLAWNSTITQASKGLSDTWLVSPNFNYELLSSNCSPDSNNQAVASGQGFGAGNSVNGTYLIEGHVLATVYAISASSTTIPGSYSWTLNLGAQ